MPKKQNMPWMRPSLGQNNATAAVSITNPKIIENQKKLDSLNAAWGGGLIAICKDKLGT